MGIHSRANMHIYQTRANTFEISLNIGTGRANIEQYPTRANTQNDNADQGQHQINHLIK